jgi:hypothetical protein
MILKQVEHSSGTTEANIASSFSTLNFKLHSNYSRFLIPGGKGARYGVVK